MSVTGTTSFTITAAPNVDDLYVTPQKSFRLKIVLASYIDIIGYIPFTVTVNRYTCTSATVYTPSASVASPFAYTIGSGASTTTAPTYTSSPYTCGETVTFSLSLNPSGPAPAYVTISSSTGVVTINTADSSISSNINLRITVTRTS